jgi:uncharacterized protein DUF4340
MRGLRSTLALLVVLIGLGAYIYFVVSKQSDDTATTQEKMFASLEADKIEELKIKSESGDVTDLKKDAGAWRIVAPVAAPASETDASGIANVLGQLKIVRVIDENPADVKEYGLDAPRIEIDFKADGGKTSGRLLLGSKTTTGGDLYARRNDEKRVLLIGQYEEAPLNKSTFDLRDKSIVKFERDKVDGVDVTRDGGGVEFAKTGTDWRMTRPLAAHADFSAVEGLIARVETAQMKSVVASAPTAADLKKFGLDKPAIVVNVHLGSARATLQIGGKAEDGTVYARDASKPDVYTVDSTLASDLTKPVDDYRRKDLFEFRAFNANRVELTRNGQTIVFERVKGEGEAPSKWRRLSPTPGEPESSKVDSLLAGLADMRATSFVTSTAKTGLDSPAMTVVAKFDDGKKEERVTFGRTGSDVFAARPDDPGAAKIEAEKFDEAIKALDELSK